jgi:AbrB family looped-hinge helix DNA binding protein
MAKSPMDDRKLYGTATVGTKGQIVIPADAREEMGIKSGDRLYVIGKPDGGFVGLLKEETLEALVQQFSQQVEAFNALKQENNKE